MTHSEKQMPKVKYGESAPKLDKIQLEFMKYVEDYNLVRVQKLKRLRRNNLLTAGALMTTALGIYAYSIMSVKQERFLEDFEEPKKMSNEKL